MPRLVERRSGDPIPYHELENRTQVLTESDRKLGYDHPPCLEYLWVASYVTWPIPFTGGKYGFCFNVYGHSAIRFTLPQIPEELSETYDQDGVVMNIEGKLKSGQMVHFHPPSEYLFTNLCPQGGIQNRRIFGVRFYDLPPEKLTRLYEYYRRIEENGSRFHIALFPLYNFLRHFLPIVERGNCARWTLKGAEEAGIFKTYTSFPKSALIRMWEENEDTHLVEYCQHPDTKDSYVRSGTPITMATPFNWLQSWFYRDMGKFSDLAIEIEDNRGIPVRRLEALPRCEIRNLVNRPEFQTPVILGCGWATYQIMGLPLKMGLGGLRKLLRVG